MVGQIGTDDAMIGMGRGSIVNDLLISNLESQSTVEDEPREEDGVEYGTLESLGLQRWVPIKMYIRSNINVYYMISWAQIFFLLLLVMSARFGSAELSAS